MTKKQRKAKNKLEKSKWLLDVAMCNSIQSNLELERVIFFSKGKDDFSYFIENAQYNKKKSDNNLIMANVRYEAALSELEKVM